MIILGSIFSLLDGFSYIIRQKIYSSNNLYANLVPVNLLMIDNPFEILYKKIHQSFHFLFRPVEVFG